jgi:CubicO group peptidase (beta-lactamase class C family)
MKTTSLLTLLALIISLTCMKAADIDTNLAMVDALFHDYDRPDVPGASVMVIRNGKVLLAKSYGMADLENKVPSAPDVNYRLASVTKQFTAMAIMMLVDAGKMSFDDPITKFFPEFPAYGKRITVRHLLNHTSGLIDYEDMIPQGTTLPVLDINALRLLQVQDHTYFPPGSQFRYSNTGYAFLALIVEKVSGQTFAAFLRDKIFQPLGMKQSLAYESGISAVSNRAYGYTEQKKGGYSKTDQSLTSSVLGDGGVYSSINDLYKWDQSLYTTKLVSKKILAEAFTPGKSTLHEKDLRYGFGWFISEYRGLRKIWHYGSTVGFSTRLERFPDKKFTVIILSNRNDAQLSELPEKLTDIYLFDSKPAGK